MLFGHRATARVRSYLLLAALASVQWSDAAYAVDASASPRIVASSSILEPCRLPDLSRPAKCSQFEVPENPERPNGRQLAIHVAVVPAQSGSSLDDPIVVLMGGPGEAAISAAAYFTERLEPLLQERDLLLVDQRGTGRIAANFPNRIEVLMRNQGHTEWNECLGRLYERFVRSGTVRGLDASACAPVPRPPFKTRPDVPGRANLNQ